MIMNVADLENINWLWVLIGTLATWRITSILRSEGIAEPFRKIFRVNDDKYTPFYLLGKEIHFFGELVTCFWCLSVWVGGLVTLLILVLPWILIPFALSGVAIIIEERVFTTNE